MDSFRRAGKLIRAWFDPEYYEEYKQERCKEIIKQGRKKKGGVKKWQKTKS